MGISINGLNVIFDKLGSLTETENIERGLNDAVMLVERSAKQFAPKGELRNSIASKIEGLSGYVYTPLEYAPYVEYGTGLFATGEGGGRKEVPWVYVENQEASGRGKTIHTKESAAQAVAYLRSKGLPAFSSYGQKPQPYMRPALDTNKETILKLLGEGLVND